MDPRQQGQPPGRPRRGLLGDPRDEKTHIAKQPEQRNDPDPEQHPSPPGPGQVPTVQRMEPLCESSGPAELTGPHGQAQQEQGSTARPREGRADRGQDDQHRAGDAHCDPVPAVMPRVGADTTTPFPPVVVGEIGAVLRLMSGADSRRLEVGVMGPTTGRVVALL